MKGLLIAALTAALVGVPAVTGTEIHRQPLEITKIESGTVPGTVKRSETHEIEFYGALQIVNAFPIVNEPEEPYIEPTAPIQEMPGGWAYYGRCTVTFYCPGPCCCGQYASGYTASGTLATAGRTVAMSGLPFGTRVLVDGQEYIVEDRGVGGLWVDIFVDSHEEALRRGMYETDVYIWQ